jgi:hypothetical protein
MRDAALRERWDRTSFIAACLINSNPFRKGPAISPQRLNPYANSARRKPTMVMTIGQFLDLNPDAFGAR